MNLPICALISIRNGDLFLPTFLQQLQSVQNEIEQIILINDNSTDSSLSTLRKWASDKPNVDVYDSPANGLVDSLNFGIRKSKCDWIARFDVDDHYDPIRLRAQFERTFDPNVAAIFCDYSVNDPNNIFKVTFPSPIFPTATILSLISNRRTPHPGALLNREKVLKVGGYSKDFFPAEDLDLWFRLSSVGDLVGVPQILLDYNRHSSSITATKRNLVKAVQLSILENETNRLLLEKSYIHVTSNFLEAIESYENFPDANSRKFFLLFDLFTVNYHYKIQTWSRFFAKILKLLVLKPLMTVSILRSASLFGMNSLWKLLTK
jgi:glycosyltransferase involved in cell wall biosynthesis